LFGSFSEKHVWGSAPRLAEEVHDFGSILKLTEYNFNMPYIDGPPDNGYADYNAPDNQNGNIPLSDFFQLSQPRPFLPITTLKGYKFFQNFYQPTGSTLGRHRLRNLHFLGNTPSSKACWQAGQQRWNLAVALHLAKLAIGHQQSRADPALDVIG